MCVRTAQRCASAPFLNRLVPPPPQPDPLQLQEPEPRGCGGGSGVLRIGSLEVRGDGWVGGCGGMDGWMDGWMDG